MNKPQRRKTPPRPKVRYDWRRRQANARAYALRGLRMLADEAMAKGEALTPEMIEAGRLANVIEAQS